jgi:hypothetical protein
MASSIDVELILCTIDEACQGWQQQFRRITINERMQSIWKLFYNCTLALIRLSISGNDKEQTKQDRLNAERIVSKLKELRDSLGDLWPSNMDHFEEISLVLVHFISWHQSFLILFHFILIWMF